MLADITPNKVPGVSSDYNPVPSFLAPVHAQCQQKRNLNVQEHVSFMLLRDSGVPVPKFGVATNKEDAKVIAEKLDSLDLVVKAQVLTGGRGKGHFKGGLRGGVKLAFSQIVVVVFITEANFKGGRNFIIYPLSLFNRLILVGAVRESDDIYPSESY
ncbi:hypothetical protein QYM36_004788 [Artemia franciscana]|uniref:ATP-grasp domain-containing protein n=1 Tax=Artemia franciscana TaxID=6661 RepID=A0AA88I024_ARTSF|nr:hypothetical protein QYM36_004788 [Artemia franciscana]